MLAGGRQDEIICMDSCAVGQGIFHAIYENDVGECVQSCQRAMAEKKEEERQKDNIATEYVLSNPLHPGFSSVAGLFSVPAVALFAGVRSIASQK